jgi:hypothetical protein
MKNIFNFSKLLIVISIFFASCNNMTVSTGDGDNKVEGNGKEVLKTRDVSRFNEINIEGVFNVFLSQGDRASVKVETDENIEPMVLTTVENNVLVLKMKGNMEVSKMKKINIYICCENISQLTSNGVGTLKCTNQLKLKNFELICKGVGETDLNLSVEKLNINSEIVGALLLKGSATEASINHSGIGIIQAFDLKTEKLSLNLDGVGAAEVFASKELNISSSGLGAVKYKGNPAVKNIKKEGLGKIESAEL